MKTVLFLIVLLICSSYIFAQTIKETDKGYSFKTDIYSAYAGPVAGGNLSGLKIRDTEFISQIIDTDRGSFLIFDENGKRAEITETYAENNVLSVKTDICSLLLEFYPDRIEITAKDVSQKGKFRICLDHSANLVKDENGNYIKENIIDKKNGSLTFISGRAGLNISGDCSFTGPVFACYATECFFGPGETKKITLTPIYSLEEKDLVESIACPFRDLMLYTPKNYQVFQRETKDKGFISLNGKIGKDISDLSCSVSGKDLNSKTVSLKNHKIKTDRNGSFNENIEFNAGGWYKLEITYKKEGKEYKETIDNIGIGEIILGGGQSNSTNCGQYRMKTETRMVSNTDGVRWIIADDPQISPHDGEDIGSFWPVLGDILYKEFKVPIAVVPTGYGNTKAEHWQPNAEPQFNRANIKDEINLYDYMVTMMKFFGKKGFRCILWHQGESDWETPGWLYYQRMCDMIWASKRDTGWDVPWFTAKASFIPKKYWGGKWHYGFIDAITEAQQKLWDDGVSFEGPNTDTLQGDMRDNSGVHLSPKGLKTHAQMWADFVIPYIHSQID